MKPGHCAKMLGFLLLLLLPSGCARVVRNPAPLPVQATELAVAAEYLIHPGDQLDVKFFYNPELNETVTVRPDGRIALQLIGEIDAAGKSAARLTALLIERYATQIKAPEITVLLRTFSAEKVYVDGEVTRAGLVQLTEPMTVLQAISQAGGAKLDTARMEEVILIRKTDQGSATTTLNLAQALDGSDPKQDLKLRPYDIVFVPRTAIANVDLWVDQYIRRVLPFTLTAGPSFEIR